tara:strand:- start:215 stop:769 length:555 start_codon:yes stop_codon:yes gene_type:complete
MTYFVVKGISGNGTETQIKATQDGELEVRAIVETELEHASANGRAYAWRSANTDIDAGDTRLFIKNTSDKFLVLSYGTFDPSNVVCSYDIGIGNATTTATGTSITATNLNGTVAVAESYIAFDDETAVADAAPIVSYTVGTTASMRCELDGFILGKNQYLQINQETESTSGRVTIFGHFENELV